jgi:hypothetical protein
MPSRWCCTPQRNTHKRRNIPAISHRLELLFFVFSDLFRVLNLWVVFDMLAIKSKYISRVTIYSLLDS